MGVGIWEWVSTEASAQFEETAAMPHFLVTLWGRLSGGRSQDREEVARIGVLQQAAVRCRAEYAQAKEAAAASAAAALPGSARAGGIQDSLSSRRKQVEDAENAYALALQVWNNKQSRLKSR